MRLDKENVLKHVLAVVAQDPTVPEEEKRDGLPVISIDGVKCAVDAMRATLQVGEGRDQRWWQVALHDATPRRFMSREEQERLQAEVEDWWMVTSQARTAFVRAPSRSLAMQHFADRFPGEGGLDAELARGFEFVDPESDKLRCASVSEVQES